MLIGQVLCLLGYASNEYKFEAPFMSTAVKPVKKRTEEKIKFDKKKIADQKKDEGKKEVNAVKDAMMASNAAKRRVVLGASFLQGNRHAEDADPIITMKNDDDYKKFLASDTLFTHPFMLTGSAVVSAVVNDKENAGKWLSMWHCLWYSIGACHV